MTRSASRRLLALLLLVLGGAGCGSDGDGGRSSATTDTTFLTADALPVFIVAEPIPAGTEATAALGDGLLRPDEVSQAQFPENAIVSIELIDGMVASRDLAVDTIVTTGMFVPPDQVTEAPATTEQPAPPTSAATASASTDPSTP